MIAIRKEFPDAKIIILTTYESDVQGAIKLGASAYLLKTHLDKELLAFGPYKPGNRGSHHDSVLPSTLTRNC